MVQLGTINPGAIMTNSTKSTTELTYDWLIENKPQGEFDVFAFNIEGVTPHNMSAALNKLRSVEVVEVVGKRSRRYVYKYLGPSHEIGFKRRQLNVARGPRLNEGPHKILKNADFGQEVPSKYVPRPRALKNPKISPAPALPPSMVERLLQLAIEAERIVETIPTEALINELKRRGEMK